jgi:hypothetical protein
LVVIVVVQEIQDILGLLPNHGLVRGNVADIGRLEVRERLELALELAAVVAEIFRPNANHIFKSHKSLSGNQGLLRTGQSVTHEISDVLPILIIEGELDNVPHLRIRRTPLLFGDTIEESAFCRRFTSSCVCYIPEFVAYQRPELGVHSTDGLFQN